MSTGLNEQMESIQRLDRDLKDASRLLGRREARWLTDQYYEIQEFRKASANQVRSAEGQEPSRVLDWINESMRRLEDNIKRALGEFSKTYRVGSWLMSITGIGPVLSAGLLTHLQIEPWKCIQTKPRDRCRSKNPCSPQCRRHTMMTAGHFWRYAGLDPTMTWNKGQLRPWNARLKVLVYKAEDCFVKFQNHKKDFYGKLYVQRKDYETKLNDSGQLAPQAALALEKKNFGKETDARKAYESGKLPPAHIHARAMRWTGKLFLSHLHHAMYSDYFGTEPPVPYAFVKCTGDHRHFHALPNWPNTETGKGLREMEE